MSAAEEAVKPAKRGRKLILLVVVPLVLALCGAGLAVFLGMVPLPLAEDTAEAGGESGSETAVDPTQVVFVDVPELLVNLDLAGQRLRFLKFVASLEVRDQEQAEVVRRFLPRISDNIHAYMRAVRIDELAGPDAVYRVKRDLLVRINQVLQPVEVRDVLIKEMLVQ